VTAVPDRQHYYPDVPGLGNVAVSRHVQQRMDEHKISQAVFERALFTPTKELRKVRRSSGANVTTFGL
jgi:hypothetical protein